VNDEKIDLSAYPLTWLVGRPRTLDRRGSKFGIQQNVNGLDVRWKKKTKLTLYVALTRLRQPRDRSS
jgi:hypothetical protein